MQKVVNMTGLNSYSVTNYEMLLCKLIRMFRKNDKCPKFIMKLSHKRYGYEDNLARYYIARYQNVHIGKYSYGYDILGTQFLKSMGSFCSVAIGNICVAGNHHMEYVTTSPILTYEKFGFTDNLDEESFLHSIEIGNDVWIGSGCLIFPHIKIGDGAVIAAGSIVRKDVPPYAVVGGVDRILKYRFSQDKIEKLLKIQWWNWPDEKIKDNIDILYDSDKLIEKYYREE